LLAIGNFVKVQFMIWLESLEPVLTEKQFERLSNILDNAGQVSLGVAVLAPLIGGFDKINGLMIISGIAGVIICWMASLILARKGD